MDARRAPSPQTEFSVADYLVILRRQWAWCCASIALVVAACWAYTAMQDDIFAAESEVLLADSAAVRTLDPSSQNPWFLNRELANEISLAMSDSVLSMVESELGSVPEIDISADDEADILSFRGLAGSPQRAADIANTWAELYVQTKQDEAVSSVVAASARLQDRLTELRAERQDLRRPLDSLQDRLVATDDDSQKAVLQAQHDRLADDLRYELDLLTAQSEATVASLADLELQAEVAATGQARIVQLASPPLTRANAPLSRNLILGALLGVIVGSGLALLMDSRDNTIRAAADIQALGLSMLAAIPEAPKSLQPDLARIAQADPEGKYADGYQKLRAAVEFVALDGRLRTVLVTSPNPSEGKSTTASNLAVALASVSRTAALVDVDFRRGRVHGIYSISRSPGLADTVTGQLELGQVARRVEGAEGLYVIPTGTPPANPAAFVGLPDFASAINSVARQVTTVVLDAPPLLAVSDTYTMARNVDGVILTARAGSTTKAELNEVLTVLAQVEANVLGVVLIGVKEADTYGGKYYTRTETAQVPVAAAPTGPISTGRQVQAAQDLSIVYDLGRVGVGPDAPTAEPYPNRATNGYPNTVHANTVQPDPVTANPITRPTAETIASGYLSANGGVDGADGSVLDQGGDDPQLRTAIFPGTFDR